MADINISVNNGLVSITLDKWEWTGLKVNGTQINPINNGNVQFQYNQPSPVGPVTFMATANTNIKIVNPGNSLFMESPDGKSTYMLVISYSDANNVTTLNGYVHTLPFVFSEDKPSPLVFSQGRMTGSFVAN